MESRETVLMTLMQGSSGDADRTNVWTRREEKVGQTEGGAWNRAHCHRENREPVRICRWTQGAQNVTTERGGRGGRREGGSGGRGHMWTYGWFLSVQGRNQHNTVKQLSFSEKWIQFEKDTTTSDLQHTQLLTSTVVVFENTRRTSCIFMVAVFQSLSHVRLSATSWTVASHTPLSCTIFWSLSCVWKFH